MTSYIPKELTRQNRRLLQCEQFQFKLKKLFFFDTARGHKTVLFSLVLAAFTKPLKGLVRLRILSSDADLRLVLLPDSRSSPKRLTSNFGRGKLNVALCATSSSITLFCLINNKFFLYHIPDLSFNSEAFPNKLLSQLFKNVFRTF